MIGVDPNSTDIFGPASSRNGDEACAELGQPELDPLKAIWNCRAPPRQVVSLFASGHIDAVSDIA